MSEIPERIWLQWHGDADPDSYDPDGPVSTSDVSWCMDRIFDGDIEYVRADFLAAAEDRVRVEYEKGIERGYSAGLTAAEDRARRAKIEGMREALEELETVAGGEWRELMLANLAGRPDVTCCAKIERLLTAAEREVADTEGGTYEQA